jgi:hypothetical protein
MASLKKLWIPDGVGYIFASDLAAVLEKTGPVLLVGLFLVQVQLGSARSVVDLALLGINLGEQIHVDVADAC